MPNLPSTDASQWHFPAGDVAGLIEPDEQSKKYIVARISSYSALYRALSTEGWVPRCGV